uniref:Elongation of very long chain fatty acids protein n=1 Tax=Steinernema glaseri TaxID=37863 RepID=A0A1I7ZLR5_9BILA
MPPLEAAQRSQVAMDLPYEELMAKLREFHFDYQGFWRIASAESFSPKQAKAWMTDHQPLAIQAAIVYLVFVFGTKWFMRKREAFDLSRILSIWNLFLAVFSIAGTIAMSTEFFGVIREHGIMNSYLYIYDFNKGTNGYWAFLFMSSKIVELLDSGFIVLRKRPLMFLHWYHHALTLLYAWYCYPHSPGFTRWGIYLNFFVHAFMYSYYTIRSLKIKLPGIVARFITTLQITQFIISCAILAHVGYLKHTGSQFDFHPQTYLFASFMDVSYLVLFINFFLQSYVFGGGKAKYASRKHKTH